MKNFESTHFNILGDLFSGGSSVPLISSPQTRSNAAACYARFSSDLQSIDSLDQQQRACREAAERHGPTIDDSLLFTDEAVSGTKLVREGLEKMVRAAAEGLFRTLYMYSLSRLARETSIAVPLVKMLVHRYGVRVVSVAEGIDTAQPGWEMAVQMLSLVHEQFIRDLSASVRRGHEAAKRRGQSTGDYPFGYHSVPVPGHTVPNGSRNLKVPKVCVIDQATAPWVVKIFQMYVDMRFSLLKIAKELNRLGAPKDHRSSTHTWHAGTVRNILANPKFKGLWGWGRTKTRRDPLTGTTKQEIQSFEEQQRWLTERPDLRIVSDELFEAAQQRLRAESRSRRRRENGQLDGGTTVANGQSPRQLLSCLVVCGHCGSPFYVSGRGGKYLGCAQQLSGDCVCKTTLQRARAERLILAAIGNVLLHDPAWLESVCSWALAAWRSTQEALLPRRHELERRLQGVRQKIAHLVDSVEAGSAPEDLCARLDQRRNEQTAIEADLRELERATTWLQQEPTRDWIVGQLTNLNELLSGATPAAAIALRRLVSGQIVVEQIDVPGKKRGYLRGRFKLDVGSCMIPTAQPVGTAIEPVTLDREIEIDFVDADPWLAATAKAWDLYKAGKLHAEIALELKLNRNRVRKLLQLAAQQHGEPLDDGRARQGRLTQEQGPPRHHEVIAEQVMELVNQGLLLTDIAQQLDTHRDMITAAIRFWHESRGLPVPDGRTRRKSLEQKSTKRTET
jgi:site-specific DNA recombinase